MFKMTIWSRLYVPVGTIERPTAGELLDMGKKLQEDYGAVYKIEFVICPDCGKTCTACC
jgi:hypothetical protein